MATTNHQLALLFHRMADITEILGGDRFRVNSFQRVARVIEQMSDDLQTVGPDVKALSQIEGIGKGTAQRIAEYLTTENIKEHDELVAKVPQGLLALLGISGLGPKTVALLWKQAGVEGVEDLRAKLKGDGLAKLPGLGKKKLENLRKSLAFAQSAGQRVRIGQAMPLAMWFVGVLRRLDEVQDVAYAGSLRRGKETIGDVDLLVAVDPEQPDHAKAVSDAFVTLEPVGEVLAKGPTKTSVRTADHVGIRIQVDLRVVQPDHFGAALMYFTGSKQHNVAMRQRAINQGLRLNEYGLHRDDQPIASATEQEVFKALGLDWVPPELREDRGELVLAQKHQLPDLIQLKDIRAELHAHTHASDGKWSIRELAMAAADRGFHTVAVTDHSQSQPIAHGLSPQRLEQHIQDVRDVATQLNDTITVLTGSEVDILADGSLDYPDSLLRELDVVVASPHNALTQEPAKATKRLLKAIDNRYITILGHPTGRLIGRREGLNPDMKQVIAAAAKRGIALEINANSWRLDLRDSHARAALDAGVKLAINTDAHGPSDLEQILYGVLTARRAGATQHDVINCMSASKLHGWIRQTRG